MKNTPEELKCNMTICEGSNLSWGFHVYPKLSLMIFFLKTWSSDNIIWINRLKILHKNVVYSSFIISRLTRKRPIFPLKTSGNSGLNISNNNIFEGTEEQSRQWAFGCQELQRGEVRGWGWHWGQAFASWQLSIQLVSLKASNRSSTYKQRHKTTSYPIPIIGTKKQHLRDWSCTLGDLKGLCNKNCSLGATSNEEPR